MKTLPKHTFRSSKKEDEKSRDHPRSPQVRRKLREERVGRQLGAPVRKPTSLDFLRGASLSRKRMSLAPLRVSPQKEKVPQFGPRIG